MLLKKPRKGRPFQGHFIQRKHLHWVFQKHPESLQHSGPMLRAVTSSTETPCAVTNSLLSVDNDEPQFHDGSLPAPQPTALLSHRGHRADHPPQRADCTYIVPSPFHPGQINTELTAVLISTVLRTLHSNTELTWYRWLLAHPYAFFGKFSLSSW